MTPTRGSRWIREPLRILAVTVVFAVAGPFAGWMTQIPLLLWLIAPDIAEGLNPLMVAAVAVTTSLAVAYLIGTFPAAAAGFAMAVIGPKVPEGPGRWIVAAAIGAICILPQVGVLTAPDRGPGDGPAIASLPGAVYLLLIPGIAGALVCTRLVRDLLR